MKKKESAIEAFLALPDEEKERQWKEFDKEFIFETAKPLTPAQRRLWERAKRRGRPKVGRGVKVISLSMERDLLERADAFAKSQHMSRAKLIDMGLRAILPKAGSRKAG